MEVAQPGTERGIGHFPESFQAQQQICIVEKNDVLKLYNIVFY